MLKYLSPKHIRVTDGFQIQGDKPIKLHLKNIAVMQFIDCMSGVTFFNKVCGLNRNYMAPEVEHNASNATPLVDVWSMGVILYVLIAGCIRHR